MQQVLRAIGLCRRPWCVRGIVLAILLAGGLAMAPGTLQAQDGVVRPAQSDPTWRGEYFNNTTLAGTPVLVRADADINFRWGTGSPGPGIPNDRFSVRWTRYIYFPDDGVYRFTLASDDGSRLFIDDQMAIDAWYDHEAKTFVVDRSLRGRAPPAQA